MEENIFAYINLKLEENGYTEFDMKGTNENLLYGISAILAKMVVNTKVDKTDTIKVFLEQIESDIKSIIASGAWDDKSITTEENNIPVWVDEAYLFNAGDEK